MHIKRALFAGDRDGESLIRLVRPGEMVKQAGLAPEAQRFIDTLKPDPRYTYVLCNAMGNSQYYGANSNTDWYGYNPHLDFDGLVHAWDGIGQDAETDQMKGKGWPYGYPCFYGSTVYAHHKNTDPQALGFGDVIFAAYNQSMKRVELVMRVFNEEAQKKGHTSILDRIRAGERVDVSMGTKVPFDLCSICTDWPEVQKAWKTYDPAKHAHPGVAILAYHKTVKPIRGLAITRVDYCTHMVNERGKVYPDGRKVYVYNDFCRFFDISFVWIGADRTARVMWHLSPEGLAIPAPSPRGNLTNMPGALERIIEMLVAKKASKLSMVKEVPGGLAQAALHDADCAPELSVTAIMVRQGEDPRKILSTLAALGILQSPSEFQDMVLPSMGPEWPALSQELKKAGVIFNTRQAGVDDTYAVSAEHFDEKLAQAFEPLLETHSSFDPYLIPRLVNPSDKVASTKRREVCHPVLDKVAAMYNGYRISVLEHASELFPKVAEFVDSSPDLSTGIEPSFAQLLLGEGSVVQLISSHLDRRDEEGSQIGTMSSLVATHPDFAAVEKIGAALRQVVGIDKSAGVIQAASTLLDAHGRGA